MLNPVKRGGAHMLMTESERRLDELITGAGFRIADLGVDRDQAWVKF